MTARGLALFLAMSVIWGLPYLFIRIGVHEITPATLVFVRTGMAALLLLPVALARVDHRILLAHWHWVAAFAIVEVIVPFYMLSSAEQHLSSSLAGLLVAGVPLVGTVIARLSAGTDRLTGSGMAGLVIGLAGVAAIVGTDHGTSDPVALLQVLAVVVGYALGPAILARRLADVPAIGVMAWSLAGTAVVYAPLAALQWPATMPSEAAILAVVVLAVICTAAAFLLFAALITEIGPVRATVITYVNPAVAAILGVTVLDEVFTLPMGLGLALVIVGSALATRRPVASRPGHQPEAILQAAPATTPDG